MIGLKNLKEMVVQQQLIENLHAKELEKKGAPAFDMRLGALFDFVGEGFLDVDDKKTPETRIVGEYEEGASKRVVIKPGKYYVFQTIESVNMPIGVSFQMIPRTTIFRSGILILGGLGDPGYKGKITGGMINLSDKDYTIELGARIAQLVFFNLDGHDGEEYLGNYHGGKVGSD